MKINGNIMKTSVIAVITGTVLTAIVLGSIFILPGLLPTTPGTVDPGNNDNIFDLSKIGGRVAKYIDSRSADVAFSWIYNNSFVNYNLTEAFGYYIDGVIISGKPVNDSIVPTNITVVHEPLAGTADISPNDLNSVVGSLISAIGDLEVESTGTNLGDMWPPTVLWEIAFNDGTAIEVAYNDVLNILAVVNGTWVPSGNFFHGVEYPSFDYGSGYDDAAIMSLDAAAESAIQAAFVGLKDLIVTAFE